MSHTNSTANYNLSQFLGTDKPAWLTDYNGDMSAIDAQMKANNTAAATAGTNANTALNNIGTLSDLSTTDKTSSVAAINEVDSHADTAQNTANAAATSASTANTEIAGLKTYLSLSSSSSYTGSQMLKATGGGTITATDTLSVARNSAGTLCKVYGTIGVSGATAGSGSIQLNIDTGLRPTTNITINGAGFINSSTANGQAISNCNLVIKTNGYLEISGHQQGASCQFRLLPILIFVQDFGDTE